MKKTKLFAILTSLALLTAAFAGCGSKDGGDKTTEPTASTTESTTAATTAATESTEATTEATTAATESTEATTEATTSADTTSEPAGTEGTETEGIIDGRNYTNEYYNFKMTVPENWAYLSHEETINVMYQSMAAIYEDAEALKETLKQSGTDYLFYAYSETGDASGNVPNMIAQSLPLAGSGADSYSLTEFVDLSLASTSAQYEQLGGKTEVTDAVSKDIDGHEFVTADTKTVISVPTQDGSSTEMTVSQNYAAFKTDTHIIMFVVSVYSEEDIPAANEAINSITFLK